LIKTKKSDSVKELEERKELFKTRLLVLGKQETRIKENMKEVESKINEMIRIGQNQRGANLGPSGSNSVPSK
jgi:prefoldin beta subunit